MAETPETKKPDFRNGFPIRNLRDGSMVSGQADGEELVLARRGDEIFAIGAHCTHYGGPLEEGLTVGDTVRCPWHHACFSLRTGEALRAPALDPVPCWRVEKLGDKIFVREKVSPPAPKRGSDGPSSVKINLLLHSRVSSLDTKKKQILLENGRTLEFGALLLATGADPVRLPIEGATDSQLHYLRTFADSKAIIAKAASAKRVVVVGASFNA